MWSIQINLTQFKSILGPMKDVRKNRLTIDFSCRRPPLVSDPFLFEIFSRFWLSKCNGESQVYHLGSDHLREIIKNNMLIKYLMKYNYVINTN